MGMTDPVADMFARIRNAGMAKFKKVDMPSSKLKLAIATALKDLGYIKNFKMVNDGRFVNLRIYLKYDDADTHIIHKIERVSKHGSKIYVGCSDIPKVKNGLGCAILSTSKGILSDEDARRANVGGEILCNIW